MRLIRQIIAALCMLLISLYFLNLSEPIAEALHLDILAKIQIIPAILSGFTWGVIIMAALTIIGGRIYCSALCPLGIFQDIIIRLSKKRLLWRKKRALYRKPHNWLRYSLLIATGITLILGSSFLATWLDPYSIFGRFAANLLAPILVFTNNGLAYFSTLFGSYRFSYHEVSWPHITTIGSTIVFFAVLLYLNIKHQRLWCNTLCPVGSLLGIISKFSLFKIRVNNEKCISCNACARTCKSNCIDEKNSYRIDYSRCVTCFNCIDSCKTKAIDYLPIKSKKDGN